MAEDASGKTGPAKPRDAATLVIVDLSHGEPRVLMGRRRDDQVFMPGKYVFPGGRVDKDDRHVQTSQDIDPGEARLLMLEMKGEPSLARARSLVLAAIRETFEEAGLVIGRRLDAARASPVASWQPFFALGFEPRLNALRLFGRAITPPGRPRRFDTRFFWTEAQAIAHRIDSADGELSGLHWLTIPEAKHLDVPVITRTMLDELTDRLAAGPADAAGRAVPFYYQKGTSFRRDLLRVG
jgi:8-oxo-dGTP pyrophosphatase MutT (NUDIX family)